jgi:hypothetical protein
MGAPYALSSDLVSAWPAKSLEVAQYIDGQLPLIAMTQNAQTGTTYTLAATDFTKLVTLSNASPVTVTVPLESSVPWVAGTQLRLMNLGAGVVTVVGAGGVTINGSPLTLAQYKNATLTKTGTNTWTFNGSSAAPGMDLMTPSGVVNGTLSGGEVSFSAAATLSVNGCFNSTYDAYAVWCQMSKTTDTNVDLRMRLSGTDATAANYDTQSTLNANTSIFNTRTVSATSGIFGYASTDHFSTINFQSPALAAITYYFSSYAYGPAIDNGIVAGRHNVATAYDGFSFIPASGTMTGKLRVYGLRKS